MNMIQAHRGPDDSGVFSCKNVTLGHRRLAIIDLSSAGHQPMSTIDGRYTVVHNGEIYNYKEIREELSCLGRVFHTQTDTEVILQSFAEWGADCAKHFNGMWAFAIYDAEQHSLYLSRDRLGIKPLYYFHDESTFVFASEIKAILCAYPNLRQADYRTIRHFLPTGALADGEETFFERIRSLPAASYGRLDARSNTFGISQYWTVDPSHAVVRSASEAIEELSHLLKDAMRLQLRADVPVGSCLSGGIDSSSLVALATSQNRNPVHTFSGVYDDKDCDEREYIDIVNDHCNTLASPVTPAPNGDLQRILEKITWHQDAPTAGPGLITQNYVMERAATEVIVLLDGQGGDELFAGYLPYFADRIYDLQNQGGLRNYLQGYALAYSLIRHWGPQWLVHVPMSPSTLPIAAPFRIMRLLRRTWQGGGEPELFTPEFSKLTDPSQIVRDFPVVSQERLTNSLYWDTFRRSIPALLQYEYRNSMAFSIEARVPLLDHRIVEFAFSATSDLKIRGDWSKWILRKATESLLPEKVSWRRSKLGYPTPFGRWIRQPSDREPLREIMFSRKSLDRNIVSKKALTFIWDQHMSGRRDNAWLLYRMITLELWFRSCIDKPA